MAVRAVVWNFLTVEVNVKFDKFLYEQNTYGIKQLLSLGFYKARVLNLHVMGELKSNLSNVTGRGIFLTNIRIRGCR